MTMLYLAGPMRGLPDENKPAFYAAAEELRKVGHFVFNPAENKTPEGGIRAALAMDLNWIALCAEGIALLPDWHKSQGATAEVALAEAIGIPHFMADSWLRMVPFRGPVQ